MDKTLMRAGLIAGGALAALPLTAVSQSSTEAVSMEPIVITSPRFERDLMETPAAASVVDEETIRSGRQGLQLDESLSRVPGLYLQNRYNFAQNQRISTRGFGARAPFGIRGIRIRVDGLPETLPDGQSQVDSIDLDSASRIEVMRGPSSALYGNATGGVIDITTADGRDTLVSPVLSADVGSDGYRKIGARMGGQNGPWAHHLSLSGLDYDGYRQQSEVRKRQFNAKIGRDLAPGRRLTGVINILDTPQAQDPGGLTADQVAEDRSQATRFARALDAGQAVEQQRIGLIYDDAETLPGELTVRAHYTRRDFEQQLPFPGPSLIGFDRDFYGAGLEYANAFELAGREARYVLGVDLDRQVDDRVRDAVSADGEITARTQDERQTATATGLFLQGTLPVAERLDATLGLRYDRVRFDIDDDFTEGGDDSGSETFNEPSVTLGLSYQWRPSHRLYATIGTAFETPTFTEFANPDGSGGLNPDIEPQQSLNREIGARGFLGERLRYELAVFSVRVRDELIPFELDPGSGQGSRTFYENAGETRREGVELGLTYFATDRLTLTGSWTWSNFRFTEFEDRDGNDFSGNRLPGLPRNRLFAEASYRVPGGAYAAIDGEFISGVFAENANDTRVGSYALVNGRIGNTWSLGGGRRLEGFVGVNNLLDREYFSNIRVNANNNAFFEPAPERTVYAGVELGF